MISIMLTLMLATPDWGAVAAVTVAIIAAGSAEMSRRAARKAIKADTADANRIEVEKAAYLRAEAFLAGTVTRQDAEIEDQRRDIDDLRAEVNVERRARIDAERKLEDQMADHRRQLTERDRLHALEVARLEEQVRTLAAQIANRGL